MMHPHPSDWQTSTLVGARFVPQVHVDIVNRRGASAMLQIKIGVAIVTHPPCRKPEPQQPYEAEGRSS